jgi:hypothetical protein
MNPDDTDPISMEKTLLYDGVFVSRNVSERIALNITGRKADLSHQTNALPVNGENRPAYTHVSVATTLSCEHHTIMSRNDTYHIRVDGSNVENSLPIPEEHPSTQGTVKKRGRTFHVVD